MNESVEVLERLMQTLQQRALERPDGSYTTRLIDGGVPRIGAKILEEAQEVVDAAAEPGEEGRDHLVREVADLLFHSMVMMAHRGVSLEDVSRELARREGVSGLEEKLRRGEQA